MKNLIITIFALFVSVILPAQTNLNIEWVDIPAGKFTMGSKKSEPERVENESQFKVTLSAFRMSKYEITNAQYATFLNSAGVDWKREYAAGAYPDNELFYSSSSEKNWGIQFIENKWMPVPGYENHPVIEVTWFGASVFATYAGGTLPTEAQWEYACRAGTYTPFNTGKCLTDLQANYKWDLPYNACTNTNTISPESTQAVGTYPPNAWGLHDMHGNVLEWCSDWFEEYPTSAQNNPTGASTGMYRVCRGGYWKYPGVFCRSAHRFGNFPNYCGADVGFRIVTTL